MDLDVFTQKNYENRILKSAIPQITKREACILGIDEAGRGPVLGPMVYGICYCPLSKESMLKEMKFADSKTLTEKEREGLFDSLEQNNDTMGWMLQLLSPNVISNNMLRRCKYNLNAMSHDSAILLVENAIADGVNVSEVYVDTVGDAGKYQLKLSEKFPGIKVTVSKKADSLFPIVSAASIVAKVARDRAIKSWKFAEELPSAEAPTGSGYPNDPDTKSFLTANCDPVFGFPQLVRFSWSTAAKIIDEKCVPVEWEEVDADNSTPSISNYFSSKPASKTNNEKTKHTYYTERNLKQVATLT